MSPPQAGLVGCLALTFGLLMETTLLIIRTNRPEPLHERFPELFDKKIWGLGGTGPIPATGRMPAVTGGGMKQILKASGTQVQTSTSKGKKKS